MVDAVGTTRYGYDAAGQVLSEARPWTDDTVSYTYNNRLRTSLSLIAPNASAWGVTYGYDAAERLTNVTSAAGPFGYTYDATRNMQVAKLALPNGAYITNSFDSIARLLSTVLKNGSGTILNSHAYAYNGASQRTGLTNTLGDYRSYTYDKSGQLKTAFGVEPGGATDRKR